MTNSADQPRAILIGGTSHIGKTTLAQSLASRLGWSCASTDKLARHPGRPWATPPKRVPDHVAEHYLSLSVEELIADVLRHYTQNVWPLVEPIVASHIQDASPDGLVMEGSAIWPELAATLRPEHVSTVWLTSSDRLLTERILEGSGYTDKSPREKEMIDKFLSRTLAYNQRMMEAVARLGLLHVDVEAASSLEQLSETCLEQLKLE